MKQRLLAYLLVITVTASAIVGALAVSLHIAKADNQTGEVYLDQIEEVLLHYEPDNVSEVESFFDLCNEKLSIVDTDYFVFAMEDYDSNGWMVTLYQFPPNVPRVWYSYSSGNLSGVSTQSNPGSNPYNSAVVVASLMSIGSSMNVRYPSNISLQFSRAHTFTSTILNGNTGWRCACPTIYNFNVSGRLVYSSIDISSGNGSWSMSKNLFPGAVPSPQFDFEIIAFWLGTRRYLTIVDQSLIRGLYGSGTYDYIFEVTYQAEDQTELTATYLYDDVVLIQYPGDIGYELENVSPAGVYAIDITGHTDPVITEAYLYDEYVVSDYLIGTCTNVPFVLQEEAPEPGTEGTEDSYTQSWSVYNEYVSNYNSTHVVPSDLSDRIFSTSGAKTLPAEVLIPDALVTDSGSAVVNAGFLWSFGSQVDPAASVIDFDLCDVAIIPYNQTTYQMKFWYGSGVGQYSSIDTFEFDRILEMYDVILIVNSYPDFLFESGIPGPASVYSRGFTGTSADIMYTDAIIAGTLDVQRFNCFAIITERCLQKTQLYNFSDGISSLYEVLVDYVDSEDKWKDSFLLWSSSVYYAINNLDGKLDQIKQAIVTLNQDLNTKLDTLINNTSPDIPEGDVWYTALWNWIMQFKPTNENFSNSLQVYDDNWDQIPQISAAPSVPLIPTIGG